MGRAENRSDELVLKQLRDLERENAMLKSILDKHGISYSLPVERETIEQPVHIATNHAVRLSLQEKVAVFQSLFQGRDDVFAKRWYSPSSQKAGYQPVCEREWNREYCDKRKYKCGDCPNRLFAHLSYNDFFNHLAGKDLFGRDVIGLYPICKDNTCYFLCTDFDDKNCEHGYKNDVLAFVNVCKNWNVPYYIERSRSGNGAHVWIFFDKPIMALMATYVYGLTATPIRKDGHQPIIFMQCGKIRFTSDAKAQIANQTFKRILNPRFTSFRNITSENKSYVQITKALSEDVTRNEFIIEDVKIAIQKGHTPLVLTTRTAHVRILAEMLMPFVDHVVQLIGADSTKEKRLAMQKLQSISPTDSLAIVATGKYVGEGFDYPRLDALFLTMPIAWKGNVEQYAGRLHREYEGKSEVVIYDYVDIHIPLCDSMYRKRLKGYAAAGYGKNAIMKVADNQPQELIYERNNYEKAFRNDLANAKHSVLIAVPKVKFKYRTAMMSTLSDILHNGVDVALRIKEEGANGMELEKAGIDVLYNKEQTLQCAIIDKAIVWYGNINFFDYNTEVSNIMRIVDRKIANEMIDILLTEVPDLA